MSGIPGATAGSRNSNWKGGRKLQSGYVMVLVPEHPRAKPNKGYVFEHVLMVEVVLGHDLPVDAVIHHVNENKADNRRDNFAVLQDQGEHASLHARLRVLRAGGNPWTQRLCGKCGHIKDRVEFNRTAHWCRACVKLYDRKRRGAVAREDYRRPGALPDETVRAIRAAVASGERQVDVAVRFATTRFVVNDIVKGRKYRRVTEAA